MLAFALSLMGDPTQATRLVEKEKRLGRVEGIKETEGQSTKEKGKTVRKYNMVHTLSRRNLMCVGVHEYPST